MKKSTLLFVAPILLSSCASILNSKYQKVAIYTEENNEILIDGETSAATDGIYLLERDKTPKEITIRREGFKDDRLVVMQYKKSPIYFMSWIPFGALLLLPPYYDKGPKSFDYEREITFSRPLVALPKKDEIAKEIRLNNVGVDMEADDIKYSYQSYKNYILKRVPREIIANDSDEKIELENTIFPDLLNEILKEKGYIDTAQKVLKNSYLNNLLIDASISGYKLNAVNGLYDYYNNSNHMIYVDLTINWEALDYYRKPIYSLTTTTKSGQFRVTDDDESHSKALKDALEYGLIEFMNSEEVVKLLHDNSEQEMEDSFTEIAMPATEVYVSSLSEAIKASVTVKNKEGHGSGFIISNNGYIITNYHVISDSTNLKVVMNDESEHDVKIIRVSKIHDLALLKIDANDLVPLKINDSKDIEIAADIYAVGTPTAEDLSQTISKGIISGIRKTDGDNKLMQTDASINGGNSGGAIVNKDGLVLGVVSSKLKGFGIEGVAFGIPAYEIIDRLKVKQ